MPKNIDLSHCVEILKKGGLIVAPSDTVYGLVCDAANEDAVKKLIAVKNRPFGKPISVFTSGLPMIEQLVSTQGYTDTLQTLLPGPFTVILPSKHKVSKLLESERGTLGVRYPQFEWITSLVHAYGRPLTATSANISGRPPHYTPQGFMDVLPKAKKGLIDLVIDWGKLPHNKPSSIVDLTGSSLTLLRKGDVMPVSTAQYRTSSASETRKTARFITETYLRTQSSKPLVFVLMGEMGVGKTVFSKGVGDALGIDSVVSPTYVIYYEYSVQHPHIHTLVHADFFNVEEPEEFARLGLENYIKRDVVMCIEWGEKSGPLFETLKRKAHVVVIEMHYGAKEERLLTIKDLE